MSVGDWLGALLAVAAVGVLAVRARLWLRTYRRGGAGDRAVLEEAEARQESVRRLAAEQGWTVRSGAAVGSCTFPSRLRAETVDVGACDFVVEGDGFTATSWTACTGRRQSPMKMAIRQHVLQVDAPGVDAEVLLRDLPVVYTPMLFPRAFKDRSVGDAPGQLVAAGDYHRVRERVAPLVDRIVASRTWVVVMDGTVTVTAHWEPDADELETWLRLARDVAASLTVPA
ncbi:hypothetical protein [Nocardioides terrigena]|uniref:hypothetical protein n=1 Tax=Nocardioides terrigena TaxID=424797 RepID=UPI000D30FB59|nr:hypothetical protein [Nocardioides terrigena]